MSKRIFISFAIEDANYRTMLVGQAKNEKSPFEFVDMSVKEPWSDSWKTRCRTKIKGCAGMIVLVSKKSLWADGQKWEVECAKEEGVPRRGIYVSNSDKPNTIPTEFDGMRIVNWTWENIKNFIDAL